MVDPLRTNELKSQVPTRPKSGSVAPPSSDEDVEAERRPDAPHTFTVDCSDVVDDRESFLTCVSFLCGYCSDRYGLTAVLSADQKLKFQRLQ
jgi:hypothetical protein